MTEPPPQLGPPKPRPPFSPFLMRLCAFIIDVVAIYFAGYTLEMAARAPLMKLGPFLPFATGLAAFAYFWLGNGPVGGGATFGKAVLNMRTVDAQGRALSLGASLRRTMIQMPLVYYCLFTLLDDLARFPPLFTFAATYFVSFGAFAVMLTLGYGVLTHPRRQGWHDQWAGSFVTPDPPGSDFRDAAGAPIDEAGAKRLKTQFAISMVFCAVIVGVLGGQSAMLLARPEVRKDLRVADALDRAIPAPNYRLFQARMPSESDGAQFASALREALAMPPPAGEAPLTTDTARKMVPEDGETVVLRYARLWGESSEGETKDAATEAILERIRAGWADALERQGLLTAEERRRAKRVYAIFADPFRFAMMPPFKPDNIWFAIAPADPGAGPFVREYYVQPEPKKADAAQPQGRP